MNPITINFAENNKAGVVITCKPTRQQLVIAPADGDYSIHEDPKLMKTTEPTIILQFNQVESINLMIKMLQDIQRYTLKMNEFPLCC